MSIYVDLAMNNDVTQIQNEREAFLKRLGENDEEIKQLRQALRESRLVLKMSHHLPIRVDHLRWWINQRDKALETIKAALGANQ